MRLKLIPPGRGGSPYWYVRGTIGGQRITCSTGARKKEDAAKFAAEYELALLNNADPSGDDVTFAYAAEQYIAYRNPQEPDATNIPRIVAVLGDKLVRKITQADLVRAANVIKPNRQTATKNRAVIRPAASILHYAAKCKWCDWLRVQTFKEPTAKTRFVEDAHEKLLLAATTKDENKRLLLLWLFRQGDRISDTLRVKYEDCDISARTVRRHIAKTDIYTVFPLDDEICEILGARQKDAAKEGLIFPWQTRWGASKWIRALCKNLEIKFTPHMARHTVGKRLSDGGVSLRLIMDKLGHKDEKSSLRYQRGDIESLRQASKVLATGTQNGTK